MYRSLNDDDDDDDVLMLSAVDSEDEPLCDGDGCCCCSSLVVVDESFSGGDALLPALPMGRCFFAMAMNVVYCSLRRMIIKIIFTIV